MIRSLAVQALTPSIWGQMCLMSLVVTEGTHQLQRPESSPRDRLGIGELKAGRVKASGRDGGEGVSL